jgi:hypothetical protein
MNRDARGDYPASGLPFSGFSILRKATFDDWARDTYLITLDVPESRKTRVFARKRSETSPTFGSFSDPSRSESLKAIRKSRNISNHTA